MSVPIQERTGNTPDVLAYAQELGATAAEHVVADEMTTALTASGINRALEQLQIMHEDDRSHEVFRVKHDDKTGEVFIESDVSLEDYKRITRPEDWDLLASYAKQLEGRRVVFINSTMTGGGVAMMRPPIVDIMNKFGIDTHWFVMKKPDEKRLGGNPCEETKRTHNILQRRIPDRNTPEGIARHETWARENGELFSEQPVIQNANVIVIDDPQPSPMYRQLKAANPDAKFVFRWHIDLDGQRMSDPTTPQGEVTDRIMGQYGIAESDAFVYHPVDQFVYPPTADKAYYAPATTDPFDDLNRELTADEITTGFNFINQEITAKNASLAPEQQIPLMDPNKKRILLVARFDESKGMHHAMKMGANVRRQMRQLGVDEANLPEVVIIGNGAIDDPSGQPMYEQMSELRLREHADEADGIILMRLKHNYMAMNAIMRSSDILMQTSEAEGCETRISDGIEHGLPAVVFNVGGMPAQIVEGKSGYILDYYKPGHDLDRGTAIITELFMKPDKYATLAASTRQAAEAHNRRQYTTTANATRWLRVFRNVLTGRPADRLWHVNDMAAQEQIEQAA